MHLVSPASLLAVSPERAANGEQACPLSQETLRSYDRAEPPLRDLDRLEHRLRLVHRFLVLRRRDRIGDDAGAGLHVEGTVAPDDRAQGDTGVEVAREIEVADGAPVRPAARGLQLVDDL